MDREEYQKSYEVREKQETYERIFKALSKMPTAIILAGMEVFAERGMKDQIGCGCFMHYAQPSKSISINSNQFDLVELNLTWTEFESVYWGHFYYPEIVYLAAMEVLGYAHEINQQDHEATFNTMNKFPTDAILKGCKTFEINGMASGVYATWCFVDCMLGAKNQWADAVAATQYNIPIYEVATYIWGRHYGSPELVFLVACEILEQRGAI
jgi:hypothetical protein